MNVTPEPPPTGCVWTILLAVCAWVAIGALILLAFQAVR